MEISKVVITFCLWIHLRNSAYLKEMNKEKAYKGIRKYKKEQRVDGY